MPLLSRWYFLYYLYGGFSVSVLWNREYTLAVMLTTTAITTHTKYSNNKQNTKHFLFVYTIILILILHKRRWIVPNDILHRCVSFNFKTNINALSISIFVCCVCVCKSKRQTDSVLSSYHDRNMLMFFGSNFKSHFLKVCHYKAKELNLLWWLFPMAIATFMRSHKW